MMKGFIFIFAMIFVLGSCKETTKNLMPGISGKINQVLVIADKNLWDGNVGDTIKAFFGQEQDGLPQAEPVFDVLNLPEMYFDKNMKGHRNVLQVVISPSVDSAYVQYVDSPWAKTQKYIKIAAPDKKTFFELFDKNKLTILGTYAKAERDRLVAIYKKTADSRIFNLFKNKYDILLYCPTGYYVNKDTTNFVWMSSETTRNSKGIIFFTEKYEHESQFNNVIIQDRVNEELQKYIPGPRKGSYMALDLEVPYTVVQYQYNGHYAMLFRGLWTVVNDFMAGPYELNVVLDQEHQRVIYMMGYVYYPNEEKRDMMKQVDAVLNTMVIDFKDKNEEKK